MSKELMPITRPGDVIQGLLDWTGWTHQQLADRLLISRDHLRQYIGGPARDRGWAALMDRVVAAGFEICLVLPEKDIDERTDS